MRPSNSPVPSFASGARLAHFDTLDSTSSEARRRAETGEKGPLWIVTNRQTTGYGRRGSAWRQSDGDLAATLLFKPQRPADQLPLMSILAGLALTDVIRALSGDVDIRSKWPNDVLADGAKISGLLAETVMGAGVDAVVAIGCGVNIIGLPTDAPYPTARLADIARPGPSMVNSAPTPLTLLQSFDSAFLAWRRMLAEHGPVSIVERWRDYGFGVGAVGEVRDGAQVKRGRILGIDETGALRMAADPDKDDDGSREGALSADREHRIVAGSLKVV